MSRYQWDDRYSSKYLFILAEGSLRLMEEDELDDGMKPVIYNQETYRRLVDLLADTICDPTSREFVIHMKRDKNDYFEMLYWYDKDHKRLYEAGVRPDRESLLHLEKVYIGLKSIENDSIDQDVPKEIETRVIHTAQKVLQHRLQWKPVVIGTREKPQKKQ